MLTASGSGKITSIKLLLTVAVLANVLTWLHARPVKSEWTNVPPVPGVLGVLAFALGDPQFAYRTSSIMLQNLGNTGGRTIALKDYDYEELGKWFFLTEALDARSNYMPNLASFYFGAVQNPQKLPPLLDYLEVAGRRSGDQYWRWLAQAAYLAQFRMKNLDLALKYAQQLSMLDNVDLPYWARQMPAFVQNAKGNKEEAMGLLLEILKSGGDEVRQGDIMNTKIYICTQILDAAEAAVHPLCQDVPQNMIKREP